MTFVAAGAMVLEACVHGGAYWWTHIAYHFIAAYLAILIGIFFVTGPATFFSRLAEWAQEASKSPVLPTLRVLANTGLFLAFIEACAIDHGNPELAIATYEAVISWSTVFALYGQMAWEACSTNGLLRRRP